MAIRYAAPPQKVDENTEEPSDPQERQENDKQTPASTEPAKKSDGDSLSSSNTDENKASGSVEDSGTVDAPSAKEGSESIPKQDQTPQTGENPPRKVVDIEPHAPDTGTKVSSAENEDENNPTVTTPNKENNLFGWLQNVITAVLAVVLHYSLRLQTFRSVDENPHPQSSRTLYRTKEFKSCLSASVC